MKLLLRATVAGLVAGLLFLAGLWYLWAVARPTPHPSCDDVNVRIPRGATWAVAADSLSDKHLLNHPLILQLGVRLLGYEAGLKAGLYQLNPEQTPRELVEALVHGATVPVRITLPEGWNAAEIAGEVSRCMEFSEDDFLAAADSIVRAMENTHNSWAGRASLARCDSILALEEVRWNRPFHICEGYLAPDTFFFAEGSDPQRVAGVLIAAQMARLASIDSLAGSGGGLDPHQILTLASIVEAEARKAQEQPLIAAVYVNRLQQGWKLESDPTVAFVLNRKGKRLFKKNLEIDSAFNTYRLRGLPPGPIGSPGMGALLAAANPDTTCEAMFFVSDGAKGHVFSRTVEEHNRAVARFRDIRGQERRKFHRR